MTSLANPLKISPWSECSCSRAKQWQIHFAEKICRYRTNGVDRHYLLTLFKTITNEDYVVSLWVWPHYICASYFVCLSRLYRVPFWIEAYPRCVYITSLAEIFNVHCRCDHECLAWVVSYTVFYLGCQRPRSHCCKTSWTWGWRTSGHFR